MRAIRAVYTAALLVTVVPAQIANIVGFTNGFDASYTTRLGQNGSESDLLQRFSTRDYRNFILNPADPAGNSIRIVGLRVRIQDQDRSTAETYAMVGYREDPLNPDFPDVSGAISNGTSPGGRWFRTGPLSFPGSGPGMGTGALGQTILFGINPAAVPLFHNVNLDDLWFGVGVNAGNWPTDGVGIIVTHAQNTPPPTNPPTLDQVGPRIADVVNGATPNLCCQVPTSSGLPTGAQATYPTGANGNAEQAQVDVLAQVTGGVSVTQTNQTNYPSSNLRNPPVPSLTVPQGGTTNMLSGLHPDTNDFNLAGRADDIGFVLTEANRKPSACAVIVGFGPPAFGIYPDLTFPLPFIFADPDTRGLLCVEPGAPSTMFIGVSNSTNGIFQQMFGLTPSVRALIPALQPLDIIWQGFVVDGTLTEVKATGCVTQHL